MDLAIEVITDVSQKTCREMVREEPGWRGWEVRKLKSGHENLFPIGCPIFLLPFIARIIGMLAYICCLLSYPHTPPSIPSQSHSRIYEMCFPLPEGIAGNLHEKPHNLWLHLIQRKIKPFCFQVPGAEVKAINVYPWPSASGSQR